ncbi:MazG family protein [Rhodococcus pyridinivorans]|uniref:Nucleoside triphosphate pyrophosphohydrolase n=1 Tax=Rhodococcus pyridinivorans AK37 TaxID=1114960 RepID=H0JW59_9NOCA|nr:MULTISPECIES: MazG family protein [Rhodococcus]EHK81610.1 nucleoside triphosphate pyrophosphohydrolase [Rhodococcus pyridinivorans AK37]MCD2142650.1 MazG family protein [Rhodococcus pyridinivorans]UVT26584.1 MazG family protein [Rhodococcus pyridinivorans]
MTDYTALAEAAAVMDRLWSFGGWEVTQTHESLRRYLIEETYEVLDAVESGDPDELREELGDLLLQVLFHSRIAEANGQFTVDDVAATLVAKLAARSPHLTNGHTGPLDVAEQEAAWEIAKKTEKARTSCLDGIAMAQPALSLADKVIERAMRAGFPEDLVPETLRVVRITGTGDTESTLRSAILAFAGSIRAAEKAAHTDGVPHGGLDEDAWRRYWAPAGEHRGGPADEHRGGPADEHRA